MKIFFILFLAIPLFAVKILDYNIYQRDDRVDITFSFDRPYDLGITQKKKDDIVIFTLNAQTSKEEDKVLNSNIIKKIKIFSQDKKTYIALTTANKVDLYADSIGDKFGLRVRAQKENSEKLNTKTIQTKEETLQDYDFTNYILVMCVLILLLIVLWVLKIYLKQKQPLDRNFNLIFQRALDRHNQLLVFEYGGKRYTMIVGNSNIVLDTTQALNDKNNELATTINSKEKDFDSYFEENKQRLQNLLLKQK
ncbi:hypothetical protein [Campylobacter peloridis]|uniref:hypothetical protein n=1 Tax=Campylobacter peloridis TaxID=488546 RepID=UPI001C732A4E|nr:hypothetical protein [Campylobacter peloridis]MBX1886853.1 hypothetical protein [Campylobacter peloridis]MBX2077979.1 hypothetical protein [Campylobacter peloridis]